MGLFYGAPTMPVTIRLHEPSMDCIIAPVLSALSCTKGFEDLRDVIKSPQKEHSRTVRKEPTAPKKVKELRPELIARTVCGLSVDVILGAALKGEDQQLTEGGIPHL